MSFPIENRLNRQTLTPLPGLPESGQNGSASPRVVRSADRISLAGDPDAALKAQMQAAFKAEFGRKAANREEFHAFMKQVFGDKYDANLAEMYRGQALAGNYSWLPKIEFVDRNTLQGGNGAYNAEEGVVYIAS